MSQVRHIGDKAGDEDAMLAPEAGEHNASLSRRNMRTF